MQLKILGRCYGNEEWLLFVTGSCMAFDRDYRILSTEMQKPGQGVSTLDNEYQRLFIL